MGAYTGVCLRSRSEHPEYEREHQARKELESSLLQKPRKNWRNELFQEFGSSPPHTTCYCHCFPPHKEGGGRHLRKREHGLRSRRVLSRLPVPTLLRHSSGHLHRAEDA